jgi:hypothetical protein
MYDLQWRVKPLGSGEHTVLSPAEFDEYKRKVIGFLREIDEDVILAQRNIRLPLKLGVLDIRHGSSAWRERLTVNRDAEVVLGDALVCRLREDDAVEIHRIVANDAKGCLEVEGLITDCGLSAASQGFLLGDEPVLFRRVSQPRFDTYVFDEKVVDAVGFTLELPLGGIPLSLRPFCASLGSRVYYRPARLAGRKPEEYWVLGETLVYADKTGLRFMPYGLGRVLKREARFFRGSVKGTGLRWLLRASKKLVLVETRRLITIVRRHFDRLGKRKLWIQ